MNLLGEASILADIPKPVRSHITARLAALLDPLAHVIVGPNRGAFEERPTIYVTPGREAVTRVYGADTRAAQYVISSAVYAPDYPVPEYEMADRLAAQVAQRLAEPDATLADLIETMTLDAAEPAFPDEPSGMVRADLTYTITYSADPVDPNHAL
jgi:hypothetical protein